jgi:Phage ABA sandwich domain
MTKNELRKLDALIAEHVMGWKEVRFLSYYGKGKFMVSRETGELMVYDLKGESFSPTTDPAASMQVLQKCAEKDFPTVYKSRADESSWCVDNLRIGSGINESTISISAPTLELAIALFAQKLFSK